MIHKLETNSAYPLTFCSYVGYHVGMRTDWRQRGWKLREMLRKDKHLLRKIDSAHKKGLSYARIALLVYEWTGETIDPTQVMAWHKRYQQERGENARS